MSFPHFVFMNFNANLYSRTDLRKRTGFAKPEEWLGHRIPLTRKFTVASLAAQTFRDFVLVVNIDAMTPLPDEELILDTLRPLRFKRNYVPGDMDLRTVPTKLLDIFYPGYEGPVISTRMDNDDAVHPQFLESIQRASKDLAQTTVVDYSTGSFYDPEARQSYVQRWGGASPFLSVFALPGSDGKYASCWAAQHGTMGKTFPYLALTSPEAMWLQVCHRRNLINRIHGKPCARAYTATIRTVCGEESGGH